MGRLARLLIPRKTQSPVAQPDYGTDMRAIETWAQNVGGIIEIVAGTNVTVTDGFGPVVTIAASGSGGTHYASLTGAGETVTPGALTQAGDLAVNGLFDFTDGLANVTGNSGTVGITGTNVTIQDTNAPHDAVIVDDTQNVRISSSGGHIAVTVDGITIATPSEKLAFFNSSTAAGVTKITVGGSRGGNAALAQLLTALANYGLIVDSTF